ncbi:MAG: hypothetical protein ACSLE8_06375 [Rhodococcus sp. (in: high G+C Gram-positive bacteria)]
MKLTPIYLAIFAMSAMAADYQQPRPSAPPAPPCMPKEAGGDGTSFKVTTHKDGSVYSWRCGAEKKVIAAKATWAPKWPTDPKALRIELSRLEVMAGYSADNGTFLRAEREARLKEMN